MGLLKMIGRAVRSPSVEHVSEMHTGIEGLRGSEVRCRNGLVTLSMGSGEQVQFDIWWLPNVMEALQRIESEATPTTGETT